MIEKLWNFPLPSRLSPSSLIGGREIGLIQVD